MNPPNGFSLLGLLWFFFFLRAIETLLCRRRTANADTMPVSSVCREAEWDRSVLPVEQRGRVRIQAVDDRVIDGDQPLRFRDRAVAVAHAEVDRVGQERVILAVPHLVALPFPR